MDSIEENVKEIKDLLESDYNMDVSSETMSELLMDENWSTYKMFEDLASIYLEGNDDVKKGIDLACSALTGWNLGSIAKKVKEKFKEAA